jgi:hypothetical protein
MGKLMDRLQKQLNTEHRQDAEDCLKIYHHLLETRQHVWESEWRPLVNTIFKGFPSDERRFKLTAMGQIFLKGLNAP